MIGNEGPHPERRPGKWDALAGLIVLAGRLGTVPWTGLSRDWITVLALTWTLYAIGRDDKFRRAALITAAAYLLGIYVQGQWAYTLRVLGLRT